MTMQKSTGKNSTGLRAVVINSSQTFFEAQQDSIAGDSGNFILIDGLQDFFFLPDFLEH